MREYFISWIEQYLFFPNIFQRLIGVLLFPFTILYCVVISYKRISAKSYDFEIPVLSVGNLVVGGTGKTPITIKIASKLDNVAVILRGYGRSSKGLFVVSKNGEILEDIETSGDEAMLLAKALPNATVIVSINRIEAILKAKELGCKVVILDDGYGHHDIGKFDILIRPKDEPTNLFCLPSGGYRDTKMMYSFAQLVLKDGEDFKRVVTFKNNNDKTIDNLPDNTVLLTAISKANRLFEYLPEDLKTIIYPDHYNYTSDDISSLYKKFGDDTNIITTKKDMVKLEKFNIKNIYVMDLSIETLNDKLSKAYDYIEKYNSNMVK
ncbi:MAG: tetraacyldisaccharide 4'-kinase [Campylobacterota bacterium]|nr:tetraacyldisaccharide 4'-kinase [Campylobacterota bacterium]